MGHRYRDSGVTLEWLERVGFKVPAGWTIGDLEAHMDTLPEGTGKREREAHMVAIGLHPPGCQCVDHGGPR